MTPRIRSTTVIALIVCMALPAWGQQFLLYTPQPVPSGQKTSSPDGILVQEIEIQKGDTLFDLSRKFNGRGMYYPQILLFNSIKNPNLIYPGNALRIPVARDSDRTAANAASSSQKSKESGDKRPSLKTEIPPPAQQSTGAAPASSPTVELSISDLKAVGLAKNKTSIAKKKNASHKPSTKTRPARPTAAAHKDASSANLKTDTAAGQKLFEAAAKAYRQDDCRTALKLLDRYLAENSNSPLAADATLYQAECYLKLSAQ